MQYLLYPMIVMQIRQFFSTYPIDTEELSIHGIGVREAMSPVIVDRPGGTGDWLFMFFHECGVVGNSGGQPANTLIIWEPQHGHYYGQLDFPWKHSWLHCDGKCISSILTNCEIPLNEPMQINGSEMVERYLMDMYREVAFVSNPEPIIVQNLLQNWACEIARDIHGSDECPVVPQEFLAVRRHISEHFDEPTSLADLAAMVNISVSHFCSLFRRYFKQPPIDMLIDHRMSHAVYLLRDVSLSITEIGRRVGYLDIYQFSKLFKKHYHISPRLMREQLVRKKRF